MLEGQESSPVQTEPANTGSTFVEKTLVHHDFEVWLEQEDIANIARIEYGWYGSDGNVLFEVIGSVQQLRRQLERRKNDIKEKLSLMFIINVNSFHWVTLVVTHEGGVAYYIDSLGGDLPDEIDQILRTSDVEDIRIESFEIEQQRDWYNCGIFALENARVINKALEESREPKDYLLNIQLTEGRLEEMRTKFAKALRRRTQIERKFEGLLNFLGKLNEQQLPMEEFGYENANVLLLFLETVALQDPIIRGEDSRDPDSKRYDFKQKILNQKIIDSEDFKVIGDIRSDIIFHRKLQTDSEKVEKFTFISPSDFQKIVKLDQDSGVKGFFQNLEKYSNQVLNNLKGETVENNIEAKCLFHEAHELQGITTEKEVFGTPITRVEMEKEIQIFFKNITENECYSDDRPNLKDADKIMFDFFVNVMPFIDLIYEKRSKPLKEVRWFSKSLIHKFYEFGSNAKLRGIAFKSALRDYKHYFFRFYYSREVRDILKKIEGNDEVETIKGKLKNSLKTFQNKFGKKYLAAEKDIDEENGFEFVATQLMYQKVGDKSSLETCVREYFKLMSIIDNEEALKGREKKYRESDVPAAHKKLSGKDRRKIYEDFRLLKEVFKGMKCRKDEYDENKISSLEKVKSHGTLTYDFNSMVESHAESDGNPTNPGENTVIAALSEKDRLEICEDFKCPKELYEGITESKKIYEEEKKSLLEMVKDYGILPDEFNAMVKSYVENDDNCSIDGENIVTEALLALWKVRNYHHLSNKDVIDMFNKREKREGKKEERWKAESEMNGIPKGKEVKINIPALENGKTKEVSINTDRFVLNAFEMFDNAYIQYRLVFNNIEAAFNDDMFLGYLAHEIISIDDQKLKKFLEIDYMAPYVARLVTKDKLINNKIVTDDIFLKTIELLLKDSYMKHLKKLLKEIDAKKLMSILKPNEKKYSERDIKPVFYEKICTVLLSNAVSIGNMELIFEEPDYTNGILSALIEKIKNENNKNSIDRLTSLIKEILKLLNKIAEDLYKRNDEKNLELALKLIDGKTGAQNAREILISRDLAKEKDSVILQANLDIARIRNRQGNLEEYSDDGRKMHEKAHQILTSMKNELEGSLTDEKLFPYFCVTLSDLGYTEHLLHECSQAYETYKTLYTQMINYVCNTSEESLSENLYNRVVQSNKYKEILKLFPIYLDILYIRSSTAFELTWLARAEKSLEKTEPYYQKALTIYEEVYKIEIISAVSGLDSTRTMLSIAYVRNRLAYMHQSLARECKNAAHSQEKELELALLDFEKALVTYEEVKRIQVEEKWPTHPAVLSTEQDILKIMRYIANIHNNIARLNSSDRSDENKLECALYHEKKALETYEEIKKRQQGAADPAVSNTEQDILKTMRYIANIHTHIARLNSSDRSDENKLKWALYHDKKALETYKKIKGSFPAHPAALSTEKAIKDVKRYIHIVLCKLWNVYDGRNSGYYNQHDTFQLETL